MIGPRCPMLVLLVVCLVVGLAGRAPAATSQEKLLDLLKESGLSYTNPDETGACSVLFRGDKMPVIEVRVAALEASEGTSAQVLGATLVEKVNDARDWPAAIFPWLLEKNGLLPRGAFALVGDGKMLVFVDTVPLEGLTKDGLVEMLEVLGATVDTLYPDVRNFLNK